MSNATKETVIVLDFGGQYNQLIARRVRECGVYCEVISRKTPIEEIKKRNITRNHVLEGIWLEEETINSQREVLISFTENIIGKLSDNKIVTKIIDTTNIPKEELLSQFLSFASNINTEILNRKVR